MKFVKKMKKYLFMVPPLIVFFIMMVVYIYKGFYPFGNKLLLQIDADYNYVPTFFKIYDLFHYNDSMLWDFKLGGGSNIYGSLVMNSIFSPLNWLVIFWKRSSICNFYNIILVIKFMCMSITMFIFIKNVFSNIKSYWHVAFSVIYVFSGWTFLMFSNIFYIDAVIMFPLVIMYLNRLLKENRMLGFIITLSYTLIINFYLSYMIYLFIIFASFLYLIIFVDKNDRKKIIVRLSFSLVICLGLSAFASLPTIVQILSSVRGTASSSGGYFYYLFLKVVYICMSSLVLLLSLKYVFKYKSHKKQSMFYGLLLFLTTVGIIVEPVNMAWHTGSYNCFPYRYFFITMFVMICASIRYIQSEERVYLKNSKSILLSIIFVISCVIVFVFKFDALVIKEMIGYDITKTGILLIIIIVCIFLMVCYYLCFKLKNEKMMLIVSSFLMLFEILIYGNWSFNTYIGCTQTYRTSFLKNQVSFSESDLYKYKDYHGVFNINGSYVLRKSSIANWLHIIPLKQINMVRNLGYSFGGPMMYSFGGTVFSDALLGVTDIYSMTELSNDIFDLEETIFYDDEMIYYYKLKSNIPFGILFDNKVDSASLEMGSLERQNYYYKSLFNMDSNLINIENVNFDLEKVDSNNLYHINIKNKRKMLLYMAVTEEMLQSGIEKIVINGDDYFIGNNEKIVYLDYFDGNVDIDVKFGELKADKLDNIKFGYIVIDDYDKFIKSLNTNYNEFSFKGNKLHINIDVDEDCYLFLPINNIEGWQAWNNGQKVNVEDAIEALMQISLKKGNNDIEMTFVPPYLNEGIIISLVSVLILVVFCLFFDKLCSIKCFLNIVTILYYTVSIALFFVVYVLSNFILR